MSPDPDHPGEPSSPSPSSLPARYFEDLYGRAAEGDPWRFRTSAYEAAKYAATLEFLPRPRYAMALEVGCSIGVFTGHLADRVDHLLAIDIARAALDQARQHCSHHRNVRFSQVDLLASIPTGPFDLITLAEVAYYWTTADFDRVLRSLLRELNRGGELIMVHWRGAVPDYPQTGDEVHERAAALARAAGLVHRAGRSAVNDRRDLWARPLPDLPAPPA